MAQHDYNIANGTGAAVRSDLNNALSAIVSQNSGATAPSTTYAYMPWADTTTGLFKIRNAANNGWITLYQLDGEWSTIALENGTAGAPSIYFKDSGTDTGIYSPGADQVAISTGGTGRLFVDSSGRVGLGISSPGAILDVSGSGNLVRFGDGTNTFDVRFKGPNNWAVQLDTSADKFNIQRNSSSLVTVASSGAVGIGNNAPDYALDVSATGTSIGARIKTNQTDATLSFLGSGGVNGYVRVGASDNNLFFMAGNSERGRFTSDGKFLVGTSSDSLGSTIIAQGNSSDSSGVGIMRACCGTASPANGAELGALTFGDSGHVGSVAIIGLRDGGTWSGSSKPSRLTFSTTADGASSPTERMRITNSGFAKFSNTGTYQHAVTTSRYEFRSNQNDVTFNIVNANASPSSTSLGCNIYYTNASPNNTSNEFLYCEDSTALRASIRSNGGIANFSANNVNLSDINAKKDISPAAGTWDCLKDWEIVNFRYKDQPDDADLNMGVIAQQVAESCPEVITVFQEAKEAKEAVLDEDGNELEPAQEAQPEKLGVKDQQMMWMAIKALQEAQLRIETLEAANAELTARVSALEPG